jgi:hypothetical protein
MGGQRAGLDEGPGLGSWPVAYSLSYHGPQEEADWSIPRLKRKLLLNLLTAMTELRILV